ncbi:rhomboid family intramembrane serine protease [Phaeodactylibacter sp.]|jgi:membrane associated rhomboid family serine protease|uniref:rhomboid family intramembrane serine protease n=1 Tax=Phaeodactylibacter sp. TaxID=1940289 RepID=UPI0025F82760|nr:rhomboid family intramembrane serine protease [Phaeodactylibacter sp.]MCI4650790.1 rhomboid family intramembrane serine protease [Phaeodactylibacter sp.]MCI5089747.1 rhomboid family intramembrane serine protease [Phaeodactylibacter sp.]
MFRVTEVVKHLLIINVLMYLGTMLLGDPSHGTSLDLVNEKVTDFSLWGRYRLAMFFPTSEYFRPFQIVTHMFMHADIGHLFFNMFAVFMFGPPLEATWGPKRFLFYYLLTGFGSVLLHTLVRGMEIYWFGESMFAANVPSLGASGAVFGLLVGYGMLFPDNRIMLLFPPIPLKAKYFVLIYAGVELFMGLGNLNTGVAHYAHLGGALFGFLLILYWRKFGSRL